MAVWIGIYCALSLPITSRLLYAGLAAEPSAGVPAGTEVVVLLSGSGGRYRVGPDMVDVLEVDTTLRVLETARLYATLGSPLVVVSGAGPRGEQGSEVQGMLHALVAAGVPEDRIILESQSRDTHGSAAAMRDFLRARGLTRVVIVTSAQHVPRALRAYRKAGLEVLASPSVSGRARSRSGWRAFLPDAESLHFSELCLHEYAGLAYYWVRGWA